MGNEIMKKHLFFDYDGVLVDSLLISVENDNLLMKYYNKSIHVTPEMIRKKWGRGWRVLYTEIFGFKEEEINDAAAIRKRLAKERGLIPPIIKGIPKVISDLARNFSLYIISSASSENIKRTLKVHHLDKFFQKIYGNDLLPSIYKPDPRYFLLPLQELGIDISEVIAYIGDSIDDVVCARGAGFPIIACSWGWQYRDDLLAAQPDILIDKPDQLKGVILKMSKSA